MSSRPRPDEPLTDEQLRSALVDADIRVLLAVLVHLTGDRRWIESPYLPARDTRLFADPAAGLTPSIQDEVRAAAFELLRKETAPAIAVPDDDLLCDMMSACLGERVPAEYLPMMRQEMALPEEQPPTIRPPEGRSLGAIIIGAGVSGIATAVRLGQAGVPYAVLERNPDVGGTWFENRYPDCGVDTPNHFYSFSFAPEPGWSRYFSPREDIHAYLRRCAEDFGVRPNIRFGVTVTGASWDDSTEQWLVDVSGPDGTDQLAAELLISAVGQLNRPQVPPLAGLDRFSGQKFHSAQWPADIDLVNKSVGVVGAGASAMQLVPRVAEQAASLVIFQRSKQWVRPIDQYRADVSAGIKWLMRMVPFYASWYRFTLAWRYGDGLHRTLKRDPSWPHPERSLNRTNDRHRAELTAYAEEQLKGNRTLIEKVVPGYPPYAKRMLADNGWFSALLRPNVELVDEPIREIVPEGVVTQDGVRRDLDVLVFATGFHATDLLGHLDIRGRDGRTLAEQWGRDNARAYLGITVPGFPNFFVLYGPNTNLAHGGSIIFHAECQVRYILSLLRQMAASNATSVEVREEVHDDYNDRVDRAHADLVWTHPGVNPWYRNSAGRVVSNSPWRLVDYWHLTSTASLDDYVVKGRSPSEHRALLGSDSAGP